MKRAKGIAGFPPVPRTVFLLFSLFGAISPYANAQNPGERWKIRDEKDEMTGKSSFIGLLQSSVGSNGRTGIAQVVATCGPSELDFEITYVDAHEKPFPFRVIQGNPTIIFNQIATPQPVVSMRVNIDGRLDTLQAPVSQINVVTFPFHGTQSHYDDIIRTPGLARLRAWKLKG